MLYLHPPIVHVQKAAFQYVDPLLVLPRAKGVDPARKLDPALLALTRSAPKGAQNPPIVKRRTGGLVISEGADDSWVLVSVRLKTSATSDLLASAGFKFSDPQVGSSVGGVVLGRIVSGRIEVQRLRDLARLPEVESIEPVRLDSLSDRPSPPALQKRGASSPLGYNGVPLAKPSWTGKGVIVATIDSGIDWRHKDFRNPDGSTRILAVYDLFDDSYVKSGGKIGSAPPLKDEAGRPRGTIYTKSQIDAALKGAGKVNTEDLEGHGTAVMSVAAGNGSAAGATSAQYRGVAPEADLVVVRAGKEDRVEGDYATFAKWIYGFARSRKESVVVNISSGFQTQPHNGKDDQELALDDLLLHSHGLAITVSAGNDRQTQFHGAGRFIARRQGSVTIPGDPFQVDSDGRGTPADENPVGDFFFSPKDDWGFLVSGFHAKTADGSTQDLTFMVEKTGGQVRYGAIPKEAITDDLLHQLPDWATYRPRPDGLDEVEFQLPQGRYQMLAFGSGPSVSSGKFDLYLSPGAHLSVGNLDSQLVASPGNSAQVITVGAFTNQTGWPNANGTSTQTGGVVGQIASFSCIGYRLDGTVKPDFAAPGQYLLSALAAGSKFEKMAAEDENSTLAPSRAHFAWQGTSASAPFVAGAVALLFQQNPNMTSDQIRAALRESADRDGSTGAVPNPVWGYGRISGTSLARLVLNRSKGKSHP
jgi:subtilisin family serine protease